MGYLPLAAYRKVTTWARLQMVAAPNLVSETPLVMPLALAQRTAYSYQLPAGTSVKGFEPVTAGLPAALYRKVTTVARLQEMPGPKWVASTPEVMPFSTAQRTAFSYQHPAGTS